MEIIPSFGDRHYKNQGNQKDQGPRTGKGEGVSSRELVVCSMMVFGAMVDIYCDLVGWPSNTVYQIGPNSKPGACGSDREDAQSGVYQIIGSTVGGVPEVLSLRQIGRKILFVERCEKE